MADDYHLTKTYCALDHEIICNARKICGRCRVSINHKLEEAPAPADDCPPGIGSATIRMWKEEDAKDGEK